ncbi:MAG: hypothetical protein AAF959_24245 [Cyanobacteria bacterium P01_D01_bin.56]
MYSLPVHIFSREDNELEFDRTGDQHKVDKRIDAGAPWFIQVLWTLVTGFQKFWSFK